MIDRCFDAFETFMGRDRYYFLFCHLSMTHSRFWLKSLRNARVSSCHVCRGNALENLTDPELFVRPCITFIFKVNSVLAINCEIVTLV